MPLLPAHTLLQAYSITLALSAYLLLTSPLSLLSSSPLWLLGESMHIRSATFTPSDAIKSSGVDGSTLLKTTTTTNISNTLSNSTRELLALVAFILILASITQSLLSTPLRYSSADLLSLAKQSTNASRPTQQREQDTSAFAEKLYNLHTSQTLFLSLSGIRVLLEGSLIAAIYLLYSDRAVRKSGLSSTFTSGNDSTSASTSALGLLANRVLFTVAMADMLFWGYLWTVLREEARELAELLGQRRKLLDEAGQNADYE